MSVISRFKRLYESHATFPIFQTNTGIGPSNMRVDEFDFDLPKDRIALRPANPRDSAKMLVVYPQSANQLTDSVISDLPKFLRKGDAVVLNNTKVIPAELHGLRIRDSHTARITCTLIKRKNTSMWMAFAKPAKRLATGDRLEFTKNGKSLSAEVKSKSGGEVELEFNCSGEELDGLIKDIGHTPLPPYISAQREIDENDQSDYQTIFAKYDGSVAAPTAGLHFSDQLMQEMQNLGVSIHFLTLHVGAGTFLPVKTDNVENHQMHAEWGEIPVATADSLNKVRESGGKILAVGTTVLRLLESAVDANAQISEFHGETSIFIKPGYKIRSVDMLMTNFHLPRSTLFMLVSAFSGLDTMKSAYRHAIDSEYRFYSYGDCTLLYPKGENK